MKGSEDVKTVMFTPHEKKHTITELKSVLAGLGKGNNPYLEKLLKELES
jgi:hypothetical protein